MAKVKEYKNWKLLIFQDRTIIRKDLQLMSWKQIAALQEMEVLQEEENGALLILENKL